MSQSSKKNKMLMTCSQINALPRRTARSSSAICRQFPCPISCHVTVNATLTTCSQIIVLCCVALLVQAACSSDQPHMSHSFSFLHVLVRSFAKIINWTLIASMHQPHFKCVFEHSPSTGSDEKFNSENTRSTPTARTLVQHWRLRFDSRQLF
jgi:hypothetical protein